MFCQFTFNLNLSPRHICPKKIIQIRGFKHLINQIGIRRGKCIRKIIHTSSRTLHETALYMQFQYITAPAIFYLFYVHTRYGFPQNQVYPVTSDWVLHGNCATTCCTISKSGQLSANFRIYLMFRGEKPDISGNASFKSLDIRSLTFVPQPSSCFSEWLCQCSSKGRSCWSLHLTRQKSAAFEFPLLLLL